jgi:heptosyltransferase-2
VSEKIAVLRYRYLGDTILTFPFLTALRQQYPQSQIDWFCSPDLIEIAQLSPDINQAIGFDPKKQGWANSIQKLKGYDRVYVLKRSFSSALIAFLAGIPKRIGFNTEARGFLLTDKIPYKGTLQHEAQSFIDCLEPSSKPNKALTLPQIQNPPVYPLPELTGNHDETRPIRIIIHPHSTNLAKCWPLDSFAQVISHFKDHAQFILIGSPNEQERTESLIKLCPSNLNLINLCGKTSLLQTLSILTQGDILISNDSGIPHLGAITSIRQFVLFGPTDPKQWSPISSSTHIIAENQLGCRPCRMKITCNDDFTCLKTISSQQVIEQIEDWILQTFKKDLTL